METVILGLSGGVDSSVAAELLKREYRVLALYLENGAPGGQEAARAAAARAGIELAVGDVRGAMEESVCAPFAAAYACAGRLPDLSLLPEGQGCIGRLHLLPYFPPGSSELAQAVAALARQGKCVLLAKHGLVAWGQSPAEALAIAEATARYLEGAQYHVSISHRDLSRANTKA